MNLKDKRIGNTEIKNFFRAIAYWIKDPKTFYNFSLVNKLSNSACKEIKAMKIYEFSEEYSYEEYLSKYKFKALPNGEIHGNATYYSYDYVSDIEYTEICYHEYGISKYAIGHTLNGAETTEERTVEIVPDINYKVFMKKRNILITLFDVKEGNHDTVEFMNIKTVRSIESEKCKICKRFHKFLFIQGTQRYWYAKDCYSKDKYEFSIWSTLPEDIYNEIYGIEKKRNLIKSVVQYTLKC